MSVIIALKSTQNLLQTSVLLGLDLLKYLRGVVVAVDLLNQNGCSLLDQFQSSLVKTVIRISDQLSLKLCNVFLR